MRNARNSIPKPSSERLFFLPLQCWPAPCLCPRSFFALFIYLPARLNAVLTPGPPACRIVEVEVVIAVGR